MVRPGITPTPTVCFRKWHLGQREMFLPVSRGFDYYLGIPYSDDMGQGKVTPCDNEPSIGIDGTFEEDTERTLVRKQEAEWDAYVEAGYTLDDDKEDIASGRDKAGNFLPLVYQQKTADNKVNTTVLEQPLDFTTLAPKYKDYVTKFIVDHKEDPFFLYMPFSHVHTTASNQPEKQYASCQVLR
jgi:arylsulfatase A